MPLSTRVTLSLTGFGDCRLAGGRIQMFRLISQFAVELVSRLRLGIKRLRVPFLIALTCLLSCFALTLSSLAILIGNDCITECQRSSCLCRIGAIPFTLFLALYPV